MKKNTNSLNVVIYGTGAIGATLGGWLTQKYDHVFLLSRGENAKSMKSNGLILYERVNNNPQPIKVKIIENLNEISSIDVVVIVVKNYNLEEVAKDISLNLNDKPIIVALQNGIENQKILPKYFTKVIYGVLVLSAWQDDPGVFGNRGKGQIYLGTLNNENQELLERVSQIFNLGFPTKITARLQDAAHSKLIFNLINSVFTLIKVELQNDDEIFKLWKIYINIFLEGVKILQVAGFKEHKLKNLLAWRIMEALDKFDKETIIKNFKDDLKFYYLNSMAQDMIIRQKNTSELESLNGYLLELADLHRLEVPYNRIIYNLCKEHFNKIPYRPIQVDVVWKKINENIKQE
ncbi:MAG: ketopantoate reductase family protein [Promethearchaeota archaeon]